ncbi:class I SAM-dependent methyltransferase [Mycobacterium sp. SM1]|uniref:class I SAM-dependent methyltransferase n=1 Tax=Mycobacterium sp. SM1 TaxID=2816243 RepID=UPI001BCB63CF|nr:class I SAM-dependent methyltransferase [Mycobacterium sp. SM1]MBS4726991.1 class I SAM-dependent methyltransferase [Mycobacterium sp. SM1]
MSAFVPGAPRNIDMPSAAGAALALTGERTVPGLAVENYWFHRHRVAYQRLAPLCAGREVLDAGCGEGYGARLIAGVARRVIGLDYDEATVAHVRAHYPQVDVIHANLAEMPLPDGSVDAVVSLQVIEHLWDQARFLRECFRVLRPSGLLMVSTPNRITFSPGRDTPINPFHTRELNADELTALLAGVGFSPVSMSGIFHGPRLREMDSRHGGSIVDAQIARALAGAPWPPQLLADVAAVTTADFDIVDAEDAHDGRDIDSSLDLLAMAVRP